jgi:thiol-disulfide isomerase/thioredoxin
VNKKKTVDSARRRGAVSAVRSLAMRMPLLLAMVLTATVMSAQTLPVINAPDVIAPQFSPKSKVRIVNLWATWCIPCVAEMEDLGALDRKLRGSGVELIGVSLDDAVSKDRKATIDKVARFLAQKKVTFVNLYYVGRVNVLQEYFDFEGEIPMTILYDASGKERARYQGRIDPKAVEKKIAEIIKTNGK